MPKDGPPSDQVRISVDKTPRKTQESRPPSTIDHISEIFSSRKHSMDYVTKDGVVLRTGYTSVLYWYILTIKELLDNSVDFLWKYYAGGDNVAINVDITKDDEILRIKVSNTNHKNIKVLKNLDLVFNYDMRYGSKQNEYVISRGMLGDAMKQILAFGYVLIHLEDTMDTFVDRQWVHPVIISHNDEQWKVTLHVDKAKEEILATPELINPNLGHLNTEIEVVLPVTDDLDMDKIEEFCKLYPLLTTDISFKFRLVDNSTDKVFVLADKHFTTELGNSPSNSSVEEELIKALSSLERKAAIKIEYPALHPISTEWNNTSSICYYKKEEILNRIVRVYDKSTKVYDVLRTTREGSNMPKSDDTSMTIDELIADPQRHSKVERLYYKLKGILNPPNQLSLPYKTTKQGKRREAMTARIMRLFPELDPQKAVYKSINGVYRDSEIIYPFSFEIIAIPYLDKVLGQKNVHRASQFIGMINYSMSPRGNNFEGYYSWSSNRKKKKLFGDEDAYDKVAHSAREMLQSEGFTYYDYSASKIKLPSIIVANLISPRVDYHGHDKSRIDTKPFVPYMIEAIHKIADGIQTFRAAGYVFVSENSRSHDAAKPQKKMGTEEALEGLLMQIRRGLA